MLSATAQNIVGLFLTLDRDLFIWITIISALVSIGIVALVAREKRWLELVTIFFVVFFVVLFIAHLIFKYLVDVPFARVDTVSIVTDT